MLQTLNKSYLILTLWLLTSGMPVHANAQQAARGISDDRWRKLTADPAFAYKNKIENASAASTGNNFLLRFLQMLSSFFNSTAGHVTIAIVAISLLVFVVYKILQSGQIIFARKQATEEWTPNTDDISVTDWAKLMQEASATENLRLAIRYGYMWLLQLFEKRGLIQYRPDKTNFEYYLELNDPGHKKIFKELSTRYEFAWYGDRAVSENEFATYTSMINAAKKLLN